MRDWMEVASAVAVGTAFGIVMGALAAFMLAAALA